jgi:uncharacterized protein
MKNRPVHIYLIIFSLSYSVFSQPIDSKISPPKIVVKPFALTDVKLLAGSPFYKAMETDLNYLLSLDINRLAYGLRKKNGLAPKLNAESYGGWEKGGGTSYGHYLSGCALMYASTGDKRMLARVNNLIAEIKEAQATTTDGWFLGGKEGLLKLQKGELLLGKPDEAGQPWSFNENGNQWYSVHKVLAGLRDAYWYTGNRDAKQILVKLGEWFANWSLKVNNDLLQAVLSVEQGGMSEVIADIYAITGDKKYLELARRFSHTNVIYPTAAGEDVLYARHANDQIPKFTGASRIYELAGDKVMKQAAFHFWDIVISDHTNVIGGNGLYERFGKPSEPTKRLGYSSSETCNTYNMLKLTKRLYSLTGDPKYMDYFERALYNNILSSQEPETGSVSYFTSLAPGMFRYYSTPENSFWCCVGTGMENHAKYNEAIYFSTETNLYVNLFIPSELNWKEKGLVVQMKTSFPQSDTVRIKIIKNTGYAADIYVRYPTWPTREPSVSYNNRPVKLTMEKDYLMIKGAFKEGDQITVILPQSLHIETVKDDPYLSSILYGPLVLAGELGTKDIPSLHIESPHDLKKFPSLIDVPYFIESKSNPDSWIKKDAKLPLKFMAEAVGKPSKISLIPFYKLHHQRYELYWKVYSQEEFQNKLVEVPDEVMMGDSTSEIAHHLKGENMDISNCNSAFKICQAARFAKERGWFSYDMKVNQKNTKHFLRCTFWGDEPANTKFDIFINDTVITTVDNFKRSPFTSLDDVIEIPDALWRGKDMVTVTFRPKPGNATGGLYGIRIQNHP